MPKLLFVFIVLLILAVTIADGANSNNSVANSKFKHGDRVWTTVDLKVRSGPGLTSTQIDSIADGDPMIKGNTGTILDGPVSKDDYIWWNISYDIGLTGWSAEKYLELVPDGPKQPDSFAQWGEDAITRATDKDRMGSKNWNEECLRFVSNAFRQKDASGESGYSTAVNAARDLYRFNQEQGGWQHAPKGAVIFFDGKGSNPAGHVGIYLGDGNIINAYGTVQEIGIDDAMAKEDVGKYIGWSYPPEVWRPEATDKSQSNQPSWKAESTPSMISESKLTSTFVEATGQSETDFTITPTILQNSEAFHIVVIGDSIAWGAGLNRDEKYSYLVAKWLSEQLGKPVNVKVLAHTGATLSMERSDPIRPPDLSSGNPTAFQQVDRISNPNDVDLILVSAGINDVKVEDIIKLNQVDGGLDKIKSWWADGTCTIEDIRKRSKELESPMHFLLHKLLQNCPNGRIIVTGYYPIISDDSKSLTDTIKALKPISQKIGDYQKLDEPNQKSQLRDKSNAFYDESTKSLSAAVNDAKSDSGNENVAFAPIQFESGDSYGADNSLLWKIENNGGQARIDDHMFDTRMKLLSDLGWVCACEQCIASQGTSIPKDVDCDTYRTNKFAAIGHPNVKGADKYYQTIKQKISDTWPEWLHPTVQAFEVSPLSATIGESFTIDYVVSGNGGSGLKQVELWRKDESSDWQSINTNTLTSETGPFPGSFTDSPSAPGKYWYGVHVVDNAGNWNDEKNSNTNGQPSGFEPVEVEVEEAATTEAPSQAPSEEWNRTFGGHGTDCANSVYPTLDGGYILAGYRGTYWNVLLVKTDSKGNELWNRTFGEKGNDCANSVYPTSDGGYIIAGYRNDYGAEEGQYAWLIKTDSHGNEIWNRTLGSDSGNRAFSVHPTLDNGYIISGIKKHFKGSGAYSLCTWLMKTDSEGNELWNRTFAGTSADDANSVQLTPDSAYILAGSRYSPDFGKFQAWLIKVDANGNELWNRTFGGGNESIANSLQITSEGGYVMAGKTYPRRSDLDALLIKTDSDGNELWNRSFGGWNRDLANSVQTTPDAGYIIAGLTTAAGYEKALLIKTDSEGHELWNRTFGGESHDLAISMRTTSDGGYIMAGRTYSFGAGLSDAWLVKVAPG